MDWKDATAPSLEDFELLAREAFAGLPAEFRALTGEIIFMVQDFPDDDVSPSTYWACSKAPISPAAKAPPRPTIRP